jgi:hypothetical protein
VPCADIRVTTIATFGSATGIRPRKAIDKRTYPHLNDVPAGGLWSTAADMQRFMLAHLQNGRLGEVRILEEETANRMHCRQYSFHPGIPGMAYGFMEDVLGGRPAWMHEGLIAGFFSLVVLVPELNLGVFAVTNGGPEDCDLVYGVSSTLLDAFFPRERLPPEPRHLPGAEMRARALEGTYRAIDTSVATFEAVTVPLGMAQEAEVRAGAAGELLVDGRRHVEVEPSLYERVDREERIAFRTSAGGRGETMARGVIAYRRVPWHASALLHRMILGGSLLLLAVTLVAWPAGALLRRFRGRPPLRAEVDRTALWLGRAVAAMPLLFFGGLALGASGPLGPWILTTTPLWMKALFTIPMAMTLAVPAMAALALKLWLTRTASLGSRLRATSIALAGAGYLCFCASWNLLGFRF